MQPMDLNITKNVFVSAVRFAMSTSRPCPLFRNELKTSAREQVEYMLAEDDGIPSVMADNEVKSVIRMGLSSIFETFETELSLLTLETDPVSQAADEKVLETLSDLEWMCNILPKMDLMKDFVTHWVEISGKILGFVEDKKLDSFMWDLKIKLIEVTSKVLEAVGYGTVILPAPYRVMLLKTWLPYIRKMKPLLDSKYNEGITFPSKMDEELCQTIEGAIVSIISALPSNDQADILADWLKSVEVQYPDLSEAFEVWCYRAKSSNRRLVEVVDKVGFDDATINL